MNITPYDSITFESPTSKHMKLFEEILGLNIAIILIIQK